MNTTIALHVTSRDVPAGYLTADGKPVLVLGEHAQTVVHLNQLPPAEWPAYLHRLAVICEELAEQLVVESASVQEVCS